MLKKISITLTVLTAIFLAAFGYHVFISQNKTNETTTLAKLTIGAESSFLSSAIWIADTNGYFLAEGLDVSIKKFNSGKNSFQAMLDKNQGIDISTVAPTPIMFNSFSRQDFQILASFVYSFEDVKVIALANKIKTAHDLKGKKIGTPIGTTGQFFTEIYLINQGINPYDVKVIDIPPNRLGEYLYEKKVDAIVIWEPHAYKAKELLQDRAVVLPSTGIYKETFNFMIMKGFAQHNNLTLTKFLKAIAKANKYIQENPQQSQDIIVQALNLNKEIAQALWNQFHYELALEQSLMITLESEARWAIKNKLVTQEKIPDYLDYIYIDALKKVKPEAVEIVY